MNATLSNSTSVTNTTHTNATVAASTSTTTGAGLLAGDPAISSPLLQFLVQIIIIIMCSRGMGLLFAKIPQPSVIAEVVTGILLGPSALGRVTAFQTQVFPSSSLTTFSVIANFGLIFFLFLVGMELDMGVIRKAPAVGFAISLVGMVTPFCLGLAVSVGLYKFMDKPSVSFSAFILFTGVAMSITAFPVLARILAERRLLTTKIGTVTMSAAAIDDVTAWILLALVTIIINSASKIVTFYIFLTALGFVLFMLFVFRRALDWFVKRFCHTPSRISTMMTFVFAVVLTAGFFAETIGIHSIFGGFIVGLCVPREGELIHRLQHSVEAFVIHLLLPLYFTLSGLRTQLGTMNNGTVWGWCILVVTTACVGKLVACMLMARLLKFDWRTSFGIGAFMNTKGLVELIVLNVGLSAGVITTQMFTMFVVMALVTTFLTGPLISLAKIDEHCGPNSRIERDGDSEEGQVIATVQPEKGLYRITVDVADSRCNASIMALAHLFRSSPLETVRVDAVHVVIFDEHAPSSYMRCEQDLKEKDELLSSVAALGAASGIVVKRHVRLSSESDKSFNLCDVAWRKGSNLLIVSAAPSLSLLGRRIPTADSDSTIVSQLDAHNVVPSLVLLRRGTVSTSIDLSRKQIILVPILRMGSSRIGGQQQQQQQQQQESWNDVEQGPDEVDDFDLPGQRLALEIAIKMSLHEKVESLILVDLELQSVPSPAVPSMRVAPLIQYAQNPHITDSSSEEGDAEGGGGGGAADSGYNSFAHLQKKMDRLSLFYPSNKTMFVSGKGGRMRSPSIYGTNNAAAGGVGGSGAGGAAGNGVDFQVASFARSHNATLVLLPSCWSSRVGISDEQQQQHQQYQQQHQQQSVFPDMLVSNCQAEIALIHPPSRPRPSAMVTHAPHASAPHEQI